MSRAVVEQIIRDLGCPSFVVGTGPEALHADQDPLSAVVDWVDQHDMEKEVGTSTLAFLGPIDAVFGGLAHIGMLQTTPVVLHTEVTTDYGAIASLRNSGFIFLQSFGVSDTSDMAVTAHLIAQRLRKPVVHFFPGGIEEDAPQPKWTLELLGAAQAENLASEKEQDPLQKAWAIAASNYAPFEWRGSNNAQGALVVFGDANAIATAIPSLGGRVGLLVIRQYAPFDADELISAIPSSARNHIAVLEQILQPTSALLPVTQDVFAASPETLSQLKTLHSYQLGHISNDEAVAVLEPVVSALLSGDHVKPGTLLGTQFESSAHDSSIIDASALKLEDVYFKVLRQLFPNLHLVNTPEDTVRLPEYAFGSFLAIEAQTKQFIEQIKQDIKRGSLTGLSLGKWLLDPRNPDLLAAAQQETGRSDLSKAAQQHWIVSSDAWAFDLGQSGVHHVLASGRNIKMLVVDSAPRGSNRGKKDVGLYAMGFGNVYVASVAAYASYTQLLQALIEAESYPGPAVVVAYLPYEQVGTESVDALSVLKETKQAVATGYWPLYRWDPRNEANPMTLDSPVLRQSLQDFLARENKLTMLSRRNPELGRTLAASQGSEIQRRQRTKAQEAYAALLDGLSGPPLLVLYASDGGQAESVAKRLARRAHSRSLKATAKAFDDVESVEDLAKEPHVVFVTSTAGQGEFPQNGRMLWDKLKEADDPKLFSQTKVAVFGMGDSQYWPRKQDRHYYNKPSGDLWARLSTLGAQPMLDLGRGDDQDANGWSTGYEEWEPELWSALGVAGIGGSEEPAPITNEDIKGASNFLRGTIVEGLNDKSTGAIAATDQQLTKFHGTYMQDDRDIRDARRAAGLEPAYAFMIRVRLPGCVSTPAQWLKIDELADSRGNGTFKITTRATFQLHGVVKENLKPAMRGINSVLMDTVAACGDVNRNVVTSAMPFNAAVHREVARQGAELSQHLLPQTTAYYEIWLEGDDPSDKKDDPNFKAWEHKQGGPRRKQLVGQSPIEDVEPLYSPVYLPRKFKINIAVPPYNDVDVYGHDVGLITIVEKGTSKVLGYNVLVGGGMGTTHNNHKTYPRTGSLIGFAPSNKIVDVCEKVLLVQRDNGDRQNRKHARLKYTVDDMTVEGFKAAVEERLGYKLEPARSHEPFKTNVDSYGWVRDEEGRNHFTTFVENGRIEDTPELQHRTGFREIALLLAASGEGEFRLTANQHIIVADISDSLKPRIDTLLQKFQLDNLAFSGLRLSSAACVAFPTCGLAMAESERYLPELVTKLESALEEYGLRHDSVVMRMTGCPNGCARPWLAEVALVGKAYGAYNLMLGGGHVGQRLNKLYRSSLKEEEILAILKPLFKSWALERLDGEPFGDFVIRKGVIAETKQGLDWWDNVEPGVENE